MQKEGLLTDCISSLDRRQSCPIYDQNDPRNQMAVNRLSSVMSPGDYRRHTPDYFEGSSSTLSSASEELYCSARADKTYYRVEPGEHQTQGSREDQATQTDDEADIDTPKKYVRPTSFSCGTLCVLSDKIECRIVFFRYNARHFYSFS